MLSSRSEELSEATEEGPGGCVRMGTATPDETARSVLGSAGSAEDGRRGAKRIGDDAGPDWRVGKRGAVRLFDFILGIASIGVGLWHRSNGARAFSEDGD